MPEDDVSIIHILQPAQWKTVRIYGSWANVTDGPVHIEKNVTSV